MIDILITILAMYFVTGIYIVGVFDSVDFRKGYSLGSFADHASVVVTWPLFIMFIAEDLEILIKDDFED